MKGGTSVGCRSVCQLTRLRKTRHQAEQQLLMHTAL